MNLYMRVCTQVIHGIQHPLLHKVPLDADCSKDKVMQIFGKKLIQISRNLGKMIWWQGKQREK